MTSATGSPVTETTRVGSTSLCCRTDAHRSLPTP
ncbi:hypothetical protein E2C01_028105 [Portunus trituberculatus]|uniref:Uncharacterized protein n=1 Tax=Portunus trituberculatus TaxID=210409 RepID=A0A5B7ENB7_PORTR|nr:hypothetical protein [Portunus trituberculatus]